MARSAGLVKYHVWAQYPGESWKPVEMISQDTLEAAQAMKAGFEKGYGATVLGTQYRIERMTWRSKRPARCAVPKSAWVSDDETQ